MRKYLIKNISIVNDGKIEVADVLLADGRIANISRQISATPGDCTEINGEGKYLLPGVIDDQVHFREPGLTYKATIASESKAAVAGGVTSFMEMPNTVPPALTQQLLEDKYAIAANSSVANYSFYMGTSNSNADEVLKTNDKKSDVCGIKIFMGSSTGNLLVDNSQSLEKIFSESELLIATHCEEESVIKANFEKLKTSKKDLEPSDHQWIRNEEACFASSFEAVQLAKKYGSRLHVLHLTTAKELELFTPSSAELPLKQKRITVEVCVHHLHFTAEDYAQYSNLIKCNPSIKAPENKKALWSALLDNRLDVIASDHAPHTWEEKNTTYEKAHAGLPLVQHSLLLMLQYCVEGKIKLEKIVEKMSHAVADCFQISERGYIREGYFADLVIVDLNGSAQVTKESILYRCGWSPFEGSVFNAVITHTFINGNLVYENGSVNDSYRGQRLQFIR